MLSSSGIFSSYSQCMEHICCRKIFTGNKPPADSTASNCNNTRLLAQQTLTCLHSLHGLAYISPHDDASLPKNLDAAVAAAVRLEGAIGKDFTFLTVTNRGTQELNLARLRAEFRESAERIEKMEGCVLGDPAAEAGLLDLQPGMRVRLTRNLDKERGFVNGNVGVIETMLTKEVFIMKTVQGTKLLVHPVTAQGQTFATCLS